MWPYLLTGAFIAYALAIFLCWPLGFPKAAKAGFLMMAFGLIVMFLAKEQAWHTTVGLWTASHGDVPDITNEVTVAIAVGWAGLASLVSGATISFVGNLWRVVVKRKQIFAFRRPA